MVPSAIILTFLAGAGTEAEKDIHKAQFAEEQSRCIVAERFPSTRSCMMGSRSGALYLMCTYTYTALIIIISERN